MKVLFVPLLLFAGSYCHSATLASKHPIVGTWQLELIGVPFISCSETYQFKANGTTVVKSASEIAESKYEISATPSPAGYYKLTDTVVKSNGKLDCSGKSTPVGDVSNVFVRFEHSTNAFSFCFTEAHDICWAVFGHGVHTRLTSAMTAGYLLGDVEDVPAPFEGIK